jgi:hypothetical protein
MSSKWMGNIMASPVVIDLRLTNALVKKQFVAEFVKRLAQFYRGT